MIRCSIIARVFFIRCSDPDLLCDGSPDCSVTRRGRRAEALLNPQAACDVLATKEMVLVMECSAPQLFIRQG